MKGEIALPFRVYKLMRLIFFTAILGAIVISNLMGQPAIIPIEPFKRFNRNDKRDKFRELYKQRMNAGPMTLEEWEEEKASLPYSYSNYSETE